jgi:hypothetical protein
VTATLIVIAVVAVVIGAYDFVRRRRLPRNIVPASELKKQFRLYAEGWPVLQLDPANVPAHLRHLIPLAEKWGIGDDIIRNDLIDKSSVAEKRGLHDALYAPFERVSEWLDSFAEQPLSPEAEAFMYMQTALDEMGYYILEEKRAAPPDSLQ